MPLPQALPYDWFSVHEVSSYHRAQCPTAEQDAQRTDDATWRDLDVSAYLRLVGSRVGIFGRQMMYHRLRMGQGATAFAAGLESELCTPQLPALASIRQRLCAIDTDITPTLFHDLQVNVPNWARLISWAPIVLLLGVLLPFLNFLPALHLGLVTPWLILLYLVFNGWTQIKLHSTLTRWNRQRDGVVEMLTAALALGHVTPSSQSPHPILHDLQEHRTQVQSMLVQLSPTWIERTPMVAEYANLFALQAYAELGARNQRLQAALPMLRMIYERLALCEARLGFLEHLQAMDIVCRAHTFTPGPDLPVQRMLLQGMVNPLLADAAPLTLDLQNKGVFLSGQNGVGKSTLLRGVGLNLLAARAFGFCYCQKVVLPDVPVLSSIHIEDSLQTADSLYMAEMRRAQTLVQKMSRLALQSGGAVFLIDEIFKGTNHGESVAAAAAVLEHLTQDGLVLVSSHNLILAQLLEEALCPLRLIRHALADTAGKTAKPAGLQLEAGVLAETNGLQMMEYYDFPPSVRTAAISFHKRLVGAVDFQAPALRPSTRQ